MINQQPNNKLKFFSLCKFRNLTIDFIIALKYTIYVVYKTTNFAKKTLFYAHKHK